MCVLSNNQSFVKTTLATMKDLFFFTLMIGVLRHSEAILCVFFGNCPQAQTHLEVPEVNQVNKIIISSTMI